MSELNRTSYRYRVSFQILFYLIMIGFIYFWASYQTPYDLLSKIGVGTELSNLAITPISFITRIFAFTISLIPCLVILYGLKQLIDLFKNYERSKIFNKENVKYYKRLGYSIFAWIIGGLIYQPLMSFVLTVNNPPGHRIISVSFGSTEVIALISGALILVIAKIMYQAYSLSDECRLTI